MGQTESRLQPIQSDLRKVPESSRPPLNCYDSDWEQRLGFRAGYGTAVNFWFPAIAALVLTTCLYTLLMWLPSTYWTDIFLRRGPTQHAAVLLAFWSAVILWLKHMKLKLQKRSLDYNCTPSQHDFVLSSQTADQVVHQIHQIASDPDRFIVFHRILVAIRNLKNLGRVSDVDDMMRSISERDESSIETSFGILGGFLWAIPVLGFIGTVLGLGQSISSFSSLLDQQDDMRSVIGSLSKVTSGLSTAFDTTLLALVLAMFLQLWMTFQKTREEKFLDDCSDYCMNQIVSRIRILPYEQTREG